MYRDELPYYRGLGMPVNEEQVHMAIENGTSGFDEPLDRYNGLEGEDFLATSEIPTLPGNIEKKYTFTDLEDVIASQVKADIDRFGATELLNVRFALDQAIVTYLIYAEDSDYPLEGAVAEYFGALAEELTDPANQDVSAADLEQMFTQIGEELSRIDELATA